MFKEKIKTNQNQNGLVKPEVFFNKKKIFKTPRGKKKKNMFFNYWCCLKVCFLISTKPIESPYQKTDPGSVRMDKRRICEGSEELRQLKERLHMAKVNKDGQRFQRPAALVAVQNQRFLGFGWSWWFERKDEKKSGQVWVEREYEFKSFVKTEQNVSLEHNLATVKIW